MAIELTDLDRKIWEQELEEFLPQKIFDAHAHFYHVAHGTSKPDDIPPEWNGCPLPVVDRETLRETYHTVLPGREVHHLGLGWVYRRLDFDQVNAFTAAQVAGDPPSAALMLVHPSFSPEKVAADIRRYGFRGLKPYRFWAHDQAECRITDMIPEQIIELADDLELIILLHLGKKLGVADEQNIQDLTRLVERYPRVRWSLAHMARSSVAWPLQSAIDRIKDLPNLWYDFAAVPNADVFTLAFRKLPLDRIMYGSDIPVELLRGTMVGFGYGWAFISAKELAPLRIDYCDPRMTFGMYETLRAARRAIHIEGFGRQQIEDLFYNNAIKFIYPLEVHE